MCYTSSKERKRRKYLLRRKYVSHVYWEEKIFHTSTRRLDVLQVLHKEDLLHVFVCTKKTSYKSSVRVIWPVAGILLRRPLSSLLQKESPNRVSIRRRRLAGLPCKKEPLQAFHLYIFYIRFSTLRHILYTEGGL